MEYPHEPVLVHEVVKYLVTDPDGTYVDGTAGSAGHSLAAGKALSEKGCLICLDRDPDAVDMTGHRLAFLGDRIKVIRANYADLDRVLGNLGLREVDGVLLDLGMSSFQLEGSGRGFSFMRDEPLDMRMDPDDKTTARDLVNALSAEELATVLRDFGEERRAKSIARAIVRARGRKPIETSSQLAFIVKSVFPAAQRSRSIHPATRTFQALRLKVNKELRNIEVFLEKIPSLLAKAGRLVILSYHSLEHRLVKQAMRDWEQGCTCPPDFPACACGKVPLFRHLLKKGLRPDQREIRENPRARSAQLRAAERI